MIRKQVENLRGLVLTPEELEKVIMPTIVNSKNKLHHRKSEIKKLVKYCYYKYSLYHDISLKNANLYGTIRNMANYEPDKLISIWDKILETRELTCPEDIDEELFFAFSRGSPLMVYDDIYEVSKIDSVGKCRIIFKNKDEKNK